MQIYHKQRTFAWVDVETTGIAPDDVAIEVAVIFTDEKLEVLETYESLVNLHPLQRHLHVGEDGWTRRARGAFDVHGIPAEEVLAAPSPREVALDLERLAGSFKVGRARPILVSDNPLFDVKHLRTIFLQGGLLTRPEYIGNGGRLWPFHYSAWSPIMLLSACGIRPEKERAHRALADVHHYLDQTLQALKIVDLCREAATAKGPEFVQEDVVGLAWDRVEETREALEDSKAVEAGGDPQVDVEEKAELDKSA